MRFKMALKVKLRAEKWVSADSVRAAVRTSLEDAFESDGTHALEKVTFLGHKVRDRSKDRAITMTVGLTFPESDLSSEESKDALISELEAVGETALAGLRQSLSAAPELRIIHLDVESVGILEDGKEPEWFMLPSDEPGPGHLRSL